MRNSFTILLNLAVIRPICESTDIKGELTESAFPFGTNLFFEYAQRAHRYALWAFQCKEIKELNSDLPPGAWHLAASAIVPWSCHGLSERM